ncbi:hypothetical protein Tco_0156063, partial [Tanacetum coccineum]
MVLTEMELVLEQTQQGTSHEVSVSSEWVKNEKELCLVLGFPSILVALVVARLGPLSGKVPLTDHPIGGFADGSSITGSADRSLGSGRGLCEIGFYYGPLLIDMSLLDYIRTANPRKVQAMEVQKGEEQVKLLDSIKHCFMSLDAPAVVQQQGGSGSGAGPEVSAPSAEENVVAEVNIIPVGTYLDLMDPEGDLTVVEKGDAARKQPEKAKRKKLLKQSDILPAKRLRVDHPSLASGTGGKTLASLRRTILEGSLLLGPTSPAGVHAQVTVRSSRIADAPVYTAADTVTFSRGKTLAVPTSDVGGSSQPETSEESTDSFYETTALDSEDAKRWYIPRWNITNDSLLDDGFSCRTLVDRVAPRLFL